MLVDPCVKLPSASWLLNGFQIGQICPNQPLFNGKHARSLLCDFGCNVAKNCIFLCTSNVQFLFQKLFNQIKFSSLPTSILLGNFSASGDNPVNLPSTSNEPAVVDQKIANSSRSDQFSFLADLRAPTIRQSSVLYQRPWVEQQKYCSVHRFIKIFMFITLISKTRTNLKC